MSIKSYKKINKTTTVAWYCKNCNTYNESKILKIREAICNCGTKMGNSKPSKNK